MKKVLVLGGTRFFGRKLVELLVAEGHAVTIVTRGKLENPFKGKVKHIIVDRRDELAFRQAVGSLDFDLVYDNICYSPNEAKVLCDIFNGKINKLVFTSTLSTYEADGVSKSEGDFDPYSHEIRIGNTEDFTYGEGKRQAEAVFFKYAKFPVVAVRFPIVMGLDDYTKRLHFHVERIVKGEPIGFVNLDARMSFILAEEAADFLLWAGANDIEGPFNATANGTISIKELITMIEATAEQQAKIAVVGNDEIRSPYAVPASWFMTTEKAQKAGFQFSNLDDWLPGLVKDIVAQYH
ncbi:NAD-dependent epimerase/dehydratase family protein [Lysinibacillus sp. 54212]|uniref:NAD-dependent epimerase/dehydratase family protein n=1 Tax=Lysinibacillus sp. 54212 TaxID=3119829 RepID=UPI002FC7066E